jgi:hypothetical protein
MGCPLFIGTGRGKSLLLIPVVLLRHMRGGFEKRRVSHVFNHKWFWVDTLEAS